MTADTPSNEAFDPNDPIVAAWANQGDAGDPSYLSTDAITLGNTVATAHRKDQRRLLWLTVREVVPSLIICGVFAVLSFESTRPAALLVAAGLALAVGCFLAASSLQHFRTDRRWGSSVRDQLERRRAQLAFVLWMYSNLIWWYVLPLLLSVLLALYGLGGTVGITPETGFATGYGIAIVVMYKRARADGRVRYESEAERLELLLTEFDRTV